jgi:membrane-associated phospholipid phosphatase
MKTNQHAGDAENRRSWKRLLPLLSLEFLLLSVLFLTALLAFAFIAHEAMLEKENLFDQQVFHFLAAYTTAEMINFMRSLSHFGSSIFLFPAYALICGYFLFKRQRRVSLHIVLIALSSFGMLHLLKRIFRRERPDLPLVEALSTYSFPSGHSLSSFVFSLILIKLVWKTSITVGWKWILSVLLILFSVSIGLSRIILKMHYPSDVIAGFCFGLIWVMLAFWLLRVIERRNTAASKDKQQPAV